MTIQLASFLIKMEYIRNMWKPSNEKKNQRSKPKKNKKTNPIFNSCNYRAMHLTVLPLYYFFLKYPTLSFHRLPIFQLCHIIEICVKKIG